MNGHDNTITDLDLVALVCNEADDTQRSMYEEAAAADPKIGERLTWLRHGFDQVTPASSEVVDAGFNRALREAYIREQQGNRAVNRRAFARWSLPLAAAAVIALVLMWLPLNPRGGAPLAWADVTRAMQETPQFRMTIFGSDPGTMFKDFELFHMEFFFREPSRWRTHGWGQVCFHHGEEVSLYDAETGEPIEAPRTTLVSMTRDVAEGDADVLDAILNELFNSDPPPGEPVYSDSIVSQAGVDVFDYAGDPTARRARVWVLRESKLPLRIHIYTAGTEDFMLVSFDYSDPKPESFFTANDLVAG